MIDWFGLNKLRRFSCLIVSKFTPGYLSIDAPIAMGSVSGSKVCNPSSRVCNPSSRVCNPSSRVCNPSKRVCNYSSRVCSVANPIST